MKKLLFTLLGLVQMAWVMAAAPAVSNNGTGDQNRQQNARSAQVNPAQIKKTIKPWLVVAVNGEGMMPSAEGGDPKWLLRDVYETPTHYRTGRPRGPLVPEAETPAHK